jgi:hypothetical protein
MSRKKSAKPGKKKTTAKRGPGRPSLYDATIGEKVRQLGSAGKSPAQIARALGVGFSTMQRWADTHPEFGEALDDAYHLARAHWEDVGAVGVNMGVRFNSGTYIFLVKNMFPNEYRDKTEHKIEETASRSAIRAAAEGLDARLNTLLARAHQAESATEAVRTFEEFRAMTDPKQQKH